MSVSGLSVLSGAASPRVGGGGAAASGQKALSNEQQQQVQKLQKTDTQVRQHEQAHKTAGGPYAGAIQFEYTTGPDGRRYVTGGEVPIDASPVRNNPEATITKMEVVKRAALAPPDPSPQDRAVASQADATKAQAQNELREKKQDGGGGDADQERPNPASPLLNRQAQAAYGLAAAAVPTPAKAAAPGLNITA
ncbi:putative metalloprotease CJM1_0395 family protein [Niveispirillum sp. BGYR6]|uniref:putative metalloprotease CJM1_0395 family protein n=1 Tax=Niveispirillum sp. BGYR6 TaxID=2971249 RepID=UPI0022B9A819|nr:putative metalloprotease CJM1_0395 family protein [Niveispirillum sp. BGYR6]MDG5497058.1 putative metalloprotease CJM1_0395 family protein [Niveispirillum sp. BGYR6]